MSKIISIIGNSGKTVLAYSLADKLAIDGKRVIVISTNNAIPNVAYVLEPQKSEKSLGRLLSLPLINSKSVYEHMLTCGNNDSMGILCYKADETKDTHATILESNLTTLFAVCKGIAEYIIVDTQSELNEIDKFAIIQSDHVFCCLTADFKGIAYREHLPVDYKPNFILFNNSLFNAYDDIKTTFKQHVRHNMPYVKGFAKIYNGTSLAELPFSKSYEKFIVKLIKEEIQVEKQDKE